MAQQKYKNPNQQAESLLTPKLKDIEETRKQTQGWIETIRKNQNRVPNDLYEKIVSNIATNYQVSDYDARAAAYDWVRSLGFKFLEEK